MTMSCEICICRSKCKLYNKDNIHFVPDPFENLAKIIFPKYINNVCIVEDDYPASFAFHTLKDDLRPLN